MARKWPIKFRDFRETGSRFGKRRQYFREFGGFTGNQETMEIFEKHDIFQGHDRKNSGHLPQYVFRYGRGTRN